MNEPQRTMKQYRDKRGRFIQLHPYGDGNMVSIHDSGGWTGASQPEPEVIAQLEREGFTFEREWPRSVSAK